MRTPSSTSRIEKKSDSRMQDPPLPMIIFSGFSLDSYTEISTSQGRLWSLTGKNEDWKRFSKPSLMPPSPEKPP